MKICFLDSTKFTYDSSSKHSNNLRGAESVLINLSDALSKKGNQVSIINNCKNNGIVNGINWKNINSLKEINKFDIVISNGDCNLFKFAQGDKYVLLSHSNQPIEQFIRKKQLFSYLKYKPKICFSSNFHRKKRSKLISLFGDIFLPWSVDDIFINTKISNTVNKSQAIFTSRPERNQKLLIDIWRRHIHTKNKDVKLLVFSNNNDFNVNGIVNMKFKNQRDLIVELNNSRVFLIPGHKAETYCLAAEEARELCIPIVTLGIGCLSERVIHGKTGFVASSVNEFAEYALKIFAEDDLWISLRRNLLEKRGMRSWSIVAQEFLNQI